MAAGVIGNSTIIDGGGGDNLIENDLMDEDMDASSINDQHQKENGTTPTRPTDPPKECWSTRHTFIVLSFLGFANIYAMRVNLSVAIVAMVKVDTKDNKTLGTECPIYNDSDPDSSKGLGPQYEWDTKEQGLILGSFFYGYVATQILGGFLAEKYGGKWIYGIGTLCTAILTLLTPLAAEAGVGVFIALRVLEGLGEGVTYPAMHALMAKWLPLPERSRGVSLIAVGAQFGTLVSFPVSSVLSAHLGWPSVFYVFGACGLVWFIFWVFLVFNNPEVHPRISQEEKEYIESNIVMTANACPGGKLPSPPLKAMLTSIPFLALLTTHMGQNWGFYTLLTEIPTYLQDIQHFSLQSNGFISGLPYLCMLLLGVPFSWAADWLTSSGKLSVSKTRKLMQTIGQMVPALGLIGLSYVGCDRTMATVWLCIAVGFNSAIYSGYQGNHMDLAPNYAGTMMGITNTMANITGFVTPYVTGVIIDGNQTQAAWRLSFLIATVVYTVGNAVFVIFGTADVQPWNTYWETEEDEQKTEIINSEQNHNVHQNGRHYSSIHSN